MCRKITSWDSTSGSILCRHSLWSWTLCGLINSCPVEMVLFSQLLALPKSQGLQEPPKSVPKLPSLSELSDSSVSLNFTRPHQNNLSNNTKPLRKKSNFLESNSQLLNNPRFQLGILIPAQMQDKPTRDGAEY